jgi:hypothetical protein
MSGRDRKMNRRYAARFIQMLNERGAVDTARTLIHSTGAIEGYTKLWRIDRLELSVEALSLRTEWQELFTDEDREAARVRLEEFKFDFSRLDDSEGD